MKVFAYLQIEKKVDANFFDEYRYLFKILTKQGFYRMFSTKGVSKQDMADEQCI